MSTFLGSKPPTRIHSEDELLPYFHAFAKPQECMRVGIEAELFPVFKDTGKALPYDGAVSVHAILEILARRFGYQPLLEEKAIIALKKDQTFITLEPGGQIELSAPPVKTIFEVEALIDSFLADLKRMEEYFPSIAFLAYGIQPFSRLDEIGMVPKRRYALMADYLSKHGVMALQMMKLTATNQFNFDYLSEEHAMASLRTVLALSPIIAALFSNACFSEGKPNGYLSKRQEIWRHTDPDRTGIPELFLKEGRTFRDYLEYILEMPLMFIVREGNWYPLDGVTFRNFIKNGFSGYHATIQDFEMHLSTAFPEARLKQYLEVRGMDGQSPQLIPAMAAFWKGILYEPNTREKAWRLVSGASSEDRRALVRSVPKLGLGTTFMGRPLWDFADELVALSCESLAKQMTVDEARSECLFLQRIMRLILDVRRSPAEQFLDRWFGSWGQNPEEVIKALRI